MGNVWVIEKQQPARQPLAQALMGDFAVRAIASLESFEKLLRLDRRQRPQVVLIDLDDVAMRAGRVCELLGCLLPEVPLVLVHDPSHPDAGGPLPARAVAWPKPVEGLGVATLLRSLLRGQRPGATVVRYRDVALDFERFQCRVTEEGDAQSLPLKEAQLLKLLLERPGVCLSRDEISAVIWEGVKVASRTIDSHVSRLRKRLAGAEVTIESVYGGGYVLR